MKISHLLLTWIGMSQWTWGQNQIKAIVILNMLFQSPPDLRNLDKASLLLPIWESLPKLWPLLESMRTRTDQWTGRAVRDFILKVLFLQIVGSFLGTCINFHSLSKAEPLAINILSQWQGWGDCLLLREEWACRRISYCECVTIPLPAPKVSEKLNLLH